MSLISERVRLAREGRNSYVICRMSSGWAVMGDVQFLPGYCLLLPDHVRTAAFRSGRSPRGSDARPIRNTGQPNFTLQRPEARVARLGR